MIHEVSFNQDSTCLLVLAQSGHRIYNCDPFGEFYAASGKEQAPTAHVRMLFSTSLVIIVPKGAADGDRVLKVFNLKQSLKICELSFPLGIADVMLNRKRLIVFLEVGQIYIYDLGMVNLVKVLEAKPFSGAPVADLSSDDRSYLVVPLAAIANPDEWFAGRSVAEFVQFTHKSRHMELKVAAKLQKELPGWVLVYDAVELEPRLVYQAHESAIAKIAVSLRCDAVATALAKGTILRVCRLGEAEGRLHITHISSLRRGHHPLHVSALRLNSDASMLGCASESHTVHLFNLAAGGEVEEESSDEAARLSLEDLNENLANLLLLSQPLDPLYFSLGTLKKGRRLLSNAYTKQLMDRLPYRDYFDNLIWEPPRRSFAYVKLPESAGNVEIGFSNTGLVLLASRTSGTFYMYRLPKGASREECTLVAQSTFDT